MKRSGPLRRRSPLRPGRRRRRELDGAASERWHETVMRTEWPTLCSTTEAVRGYVMAPAGLSLAQAHHVVPQQRLRAHALELGIDETVLLWDWRVGLKVTTRRHQRHHSRHEPITHAELLIAAPFVFDFTLEHGLDPWLARHYPAG